MSEIAPRGPVLTVDEGGFLVPCASADRIQPEWWPVVQAVVEEYRATLGAALHSVYVRGSVAGGHAVRGLADIDTLALTADEPPEGCLPIDGEWAAGARARLAERFPEVVDFELGTLSVSAATRSPVFRVLWKLTAVCAFGPDLLPDLPGVRPGRETLLHAPAIRSEASRVRAWLERARAGEVHLDGAIVQGHSAWIAKRIVRVGMELVAERAGVFTRDLHHAWRLFSACYPARSQGMRELLEVAVGRTPKPVERMIEMLGEVLDWLPDELARTYAARAPGREPLPGSRPNPRRLVFERRPFNGWEPGHRDLAALGLGPRFACAVDGKRILLSAPYLVHARNAPAFVAYIQQGTTEEYLVKTLFLSRTQNVFRLLAAYRYRRVAHESGAVVELPVHNDKGYSESSLMLPWPVQRAAARALTQHDCLRLEASLHVFYALAPECGVPSRYEQVVDPIPLRLESERDRPDFDSVVAQWTLRSALYGACALRAIGSQSRGFVYLFCTDRRSRTWIAGIESTGEVSDLGLRRRWVAAPELMTPAFEYASQAPGAGVGPQQGHYVDTYADRLAGQPLIREYERRFVRATRPGE